MTVTNSGVLEEWLTLAAPEWWEHARATTAADWTRKVQAMAPDQLQPRHFAGAHDVRAVIELLLTAQAADPAFDWPGAGQLRALLADPALDRALDARLWFDARGALIACAILWGGRSLLWFCRPAARCDALDALIVAWAISRARQLAESGAEISLRTEARDPETRRRISLAQLGFVALPGGSLRLARPLTDALASAPAPTRVRIRPLAPAELSAYLSLATELFPHATRLPLTEGRRRALMADAAYTPELDLVAEDATGALVGFCHCALRPDERERLGRRAGWIELLGAAPAHRRAGLGRALLLAGLRALADYGADQALLTVRADNASARALYEAEGFTPLFTERAYELTLA